MDQDQTTTTTTEPQTSALTMEQRIMARWEGMLDGALLLATGTPTVR